MVGADGAHISTEIEINTPHGRVRACVKLSRSLLDEGELKRWSEGELAMLFFLQSGVPGDLRLARDARWHDVAGLLGSVPVARRLGELTGLEYDQRDIAKAMAALHEFNRRAGGRERGRSSVVEGSLLFVLDARRLAVAPVAVNNDLEGPVDTKSVASGSGGRDRKSVV